jgi:hypothetical protein
MSIASELTAPLLETHNRLHRHPLAGGSEGVPNLLQEGVFGVLEGKGRGGKCFSRSIWALIGLTVLQVRVYTR